MRARLTHSLLVALVLGACGRPREESPPTSALPPPRAPPGPLRVDTLTFGQFGQISLYRRSEHPSHVVLFVSGDGGWNLGVVRMAEELAGMDAAVAGIDIRRYGSALDRPSESCGYPAADFEALSQWLQRRLGYPAYTAPILVGYSSGATLVYAILVEAPAGTFGGAISLGFCPDLPWRRPLCRGSGLAWVAGPKGRGVSFLPADSTGAPWVVLQGESDSTCSASQAGIYVRRVRGARIVALPKVGHGFSVEPRWVPPLREAFLRLASVRADRVSPNAPAVRDLPLVELRASGNNGTLAIIVSGDGGWASLDRQIGETFVSRGISVVGLDALRYFWKARNRERMGADLTRIARHYMESWGKQQLLLVGYSRGAEALPFMTSRLPSDLRDRVRVVALLGASRSTTFEFHLTDWLGRAGAGSARAATAPEIEKLRGLRVLCVYGTDEKDSVCPSLPAALATAMPVEGGHHFGGAYRELAARILRAAQRD
jgi:type IV secretory pathway VirJ component